MSKVFIFSARIQHSIDYARYIGLRPNEFIHLREYRQLCGCRRSLVIELQTAIYVEDYWYIRDAIAQMNCISVTIGY